MCMVGSPGLEPTQAVYVGAARATEPSWSLTAPGTQYEGVEKLTEGVLTIMIVIGMDVVTLDCGLNSGRTIQGAGK